MLSQRRLIQFAAAAITVLAVAACAPMRVNSYLERDADFRRYHTYRFGPTESVSTGDPRLDNNPFFNQRVQATVEEELGARGFEPAKSTRPDLVVRYHVSISQEIDDNAIDWKVCEAADCRPYVYDAGTFLIDFVDARTNRVVWRGWAEGSMDGAIDNQDGMEKKIDDSVKRILKGFPRRA